MAAKQVFIAGIDEAGRGPLAGPVTAACVVFHDDYENAEIGDSKKLTAKRRDVLYDAIIRDALAYSIVSVGPRRIEELNILQATRLAMLLAVNRVQKQLGPNLFLQIDGNTKLETTLPQETIIKGDQKVSVIGAASILAKVSRDRLMERLEDRYPGYGLGGHKGYPTKKHREAIEQLGPSAVHRRTFAGVKEHIGPKIDRLHRGAGGAEVSSPTGNAPICHKLDV